MNFYESFRFLESHKIFNGGFCDYLWVKAVKVNPDTNAIDDDKTKNTKIQIWLECGPYLENIRCCSHDVDLDCGGDTFEDAIIKLALLVKEYYNEQGVKIKPGAFDICE